MSKIVDGLWSWKRAATDSGRKVHHLKVATDENMDIVKTPMDFVSRTGDVSHKK
jgi:hypothetical protein